MSSHSSVIAYLAKGRGCDLSVPFPLVKLCRYNVVPEKVENPVTFHRLGESQTRVEDSLYDVRPSVVTGQSQLSQKISMMPTNLDRVGVGDEEAAMGGWPQANLNTRVSHDTFQA